MIVLIHKAGKSFKGLATYLTHDPKAKSDERVGWTHTLNLAHDHVGSAVGEMMWTSRSAELLKQEAGVRAGGRGHRKHGKACEPELVARGGADARAYDRDHGVLPSPYGLARAPGARCLA